MDGLERTAVQDALAGVYGKVSQAADDLTEAAALLPTRCAGWAVLDVLYHQLLDARRALRTFASPSADTPNAEYGAPSPSAQASRSAGVADIVGLGDDHGRIFAPGPEHGPGI